MTLHHVIAMLLTIAQMLIWLLVLYIDSVGPNSLAARLFVAAGMVFSIVVAVYAWWVTDPGKD